MVNDPRTRNVHLLADLSSYAAVLQNVDRNENLSRVFILAKVVRHAVDLVLHGANQDFGESHELWLTTKKSRGL
jgi:hypothetical protein